MLVTHENQYLDITICSSLFNASSQVYSSPSIIVQGSLCRSVEQNVRITGVIMEGNNYGRLISLYSIQMAEFTDIIIQNSKFGALELTYSSILFRGNNTFSNNSAYNGGGIWLDGNSYIYMDTDSTLEIINKHRRQLRRRDICATITRHNVFRL